MLLKKTRSRNKIKKLGKPLKRRKKLNNRRKFIDRDYASKKYNFGFRWTENEIIERANNARQDRLNNPTLAEECFAEILRELGIPFEREKIILNGDRFVLIDAYLPDRKMCLEIDGSSHKTQEKYDQGRDAWLKAQGYEVIRFQNKEVLKTPEKVQTKINEVIYALHTHS